MQNVKFSDIEEFMLSIQGEELKILNIIRPIIFDSIPGVREKLSYNVPFYSKNKNICFLWPSSVLWGGKKTYEGVRFGFNQGYLLNDTYNLLEKGSRKYVYWMDLSSVKGINPQILREYINEALIIDQEL